MVVSSKDFMGKTIPKKVSRYYVTLPSKKNKTGKIKEFRFVSSLKFDTSMSQRSGGHASHLSVFKSAGFLVFKIFNSFNKNISITTTLNREEAVELFKFLERTIPTMPEKITLPDIPNPEELDNGF